MSNTCFYTHTGEQHILRAGCDPKRTWIPQLDMNFCPFCGNYLKVLRIASKEELPQVPEEL